MGLVDNECALKRSWMLSVHCLESPGSQNGCLAVAGNRFVVLGGDKCRKLGGGEWLARKVQYKGAGHCAAAP